VLDASIIEEIKRRERERESRRPRLELPVPEPAPRRQNEVPEDDDAPKRGVLIIDYSEPVTVP
jgi:hypothetical protein